MPGVAEEKVLNRGEPIAGASQPGAAAISSWRPIGETYRYQLVESSGYSVVDVKTVHDWVLARRFRVVQASSM